MGCGGSILRKQLSPDAEAKIRTLFAKIDEDKSHTISKQEAMTFFKGKFGKLSADAMFKEVDTKQNGEITEEEFVAFWKQVRKSGYKEAEILEEVANLETGEGWVDWKDDRNTGSD
mmetsp:Transcript_83600/g.270171  ORF Transcript_83600/g.270171 Transcript_83600/m.270171 type:complete len:116 (+) Transcript_83600:108-455(+)